MAMTLNDLFAIICDRRENPIPGSYTASLFAAGEDEIIKKVGEEAIEVVLAAKGQGQERVIEEVADLTFHVLVLLAEKGLKPDDIRMELEKRNQKKTR
jgi:phosphoribosyl-ATP pyrophosphohydrolase